MTPLLAGSVVAILLATLLLNRVSMRVALAVLLLTTALIPGKILIPGAFSGHPNIQRVMLGILLLNLIRKIVRGEVPWAVLRPTLLTSALFAWMVFTFVIGVALSDVSVAFGFSTFLWMFVVEQFVFVVFVSAAIRIIDDPWWVARLVAGIALISASIAVIEHFTHIGYGRWLASLIRGGGYLGASPLTHRGGDVRVQAGADFSLSYAWIATVLLPLVVVVAMRARWLIVRLSPALLVVSIAWTYSRSAYLGVVIGGLLILVTTRFDRRITVMALVGGAAVLLFVGFTPVLGRTYSSPEIEGSTLVREERLPIILSHAAARPLIGEGLSSLSTEGIRTTDSTYLLTYGELGMMGIVGFVFLLGLAVAAAAPAVSVRSPQPLLGAATVTGLILGITAAAFLDEFSAAGSARTFWLLGAFGAALAERVPRPARSRRRSWGRVAVPAVGIGIGLLWLALTPAHVATTYRFSTRTPHSEAIARTPTDFIARLYVTTSCEVIEGRAAAFGARAHCYDLRSGTGFGEFRIEADDVATVERILRSTSLVARQSVPGFRLYVQERPQRSRATLVRTAPVWIGMVGAVLAVVVPPISPPRIRRRRPLLLRPAASPY